MVFTSAAKVSSRNIRQVASQYAAGVLFALLSLALSYGLRGFLNPSLFVLIFVAVTASAAYGGFGPAALTSVVCVLGADMTLIGPPGSPEFENPANYLRLAALLTGAGITSFLNAALREAKGRAEQAAAVSRAAEQKANELRTALEAQILETRKNETRLQLAIESARMVAWQWNPATEEIVTSPNLRDVFGVNSLAESSAGFALVHPDDRAMHERRVLEAVEQKRPYRSEFRIIRPDTGQIRWLEENAAPVLNTKGEITRLVGVVTDVTKEREAALERERLLVAEQAAHAAAEAKAAELERLSAGLRATNRDLDQFAYVASHDLKAPLRGIANLTQWLEEDIDAVLTAKSREQMRLLKNRVHRMEALIDGILMYSKAGRSREQAKPLDVMSVLQETIELLALPATATVVLPDELPPVVGVPVQLQQVFLNLIGNAVKHAHGKPVRIEVLWRDLGDRHEFAVRDDGPGIAPEYQERIWNLFQTLESRDNVEGAGIGLSVVRKTVESLGGSVRLSSAPGQGSTFFFTWLKAPLDNALLRTTWKIES